MVEPHMCVYALSSFIKPYSFILSIMVGRREKPSIRKKKTKFEPPPPSISINNNWFSLLNTTLIYTLYGKRTSNNTDFAFIAVFFSLICENSSNDKFFIMANFHEPINKCNEKDLIVFSLFCRLFNIEY